MIIDEPAEIAPGVTISEETAINERRYKGLVIAGICLSVMIYPYLGHVFLIYDISYLNRIVISEVLKWLSIGLLYLYATRAEMSRFVLWNEERYNLFFYVKNIILLYLLVFIAQWVAHIPYLLGFREDNAVIMKMTAVIQSYPMLLFVTCATAGITEEYIFRGYIISRLSLFFKNKHWPVIISALIFTSVHLGYKTYHELLFVFPFGLITGYHYWRYRNLTVLVAVHFITDILAFGLYHPHLHK